MSFEANKKVHTAMWTSKNKLHTNYITGGLNMNNLSQAERNVVDQMDKEFYLEPDEEEKLDDSRDCDE